MKDHSKPLISSRFRGFLPVVIDVETGGFNAHTDALLEIAAVIVAMNDNGLVVPDEKISFHIKPFKGANIDQEAIDFIGIDPFHPLRIDYSEEHALDAIFSMINTALKKNQCNRAILVGHNASFDLNFVNACVARVKNKNNPFHPFSCFDTVSFSGLAFGQTVLARSCRVAGIDFDEQSAHSARYDAMKTAELFCKIVNLWSTLGGWPVSNS